MVTDKYAESNMQIFNIMSVLVNLSKPGRRSQVEEGCNNFYILVHCQLYTADNFCDPEICLKYI